MWSDAAALQEPPAFKVVVSHGTLRQSGCGGKPPMAHPIQATTKGEDVFAGQQQPQRPAASTQHVYSTPACAATSWKWQPCTAKLMNSGKHRGL